MSTKTLRKRIALVAVSALGAGLLSVVAVPSANAAANQPAGLDCTLAVHLQIGCWGRCAGARAGTRCRGGAQERGEGTCRKKIRHCSRETH
jgi:hypothetical protein